jgi:multisubunit Na+/H+ antiporter MnhE subunit
VLLWRFFTAMLLSAWATGKVIITDSRAPNRGYARLQYGDLSDAGVMVLAAMVTLTPGTSTLDIDQERCELLLHVLDTSDIEAMLDGLQRDFLIPIRNVFGGAA